jgi:CheY-like chemotaxis protein
VVRSRLLVIDDEELVAKSIARPLKKYHDVAIVLSGEEAMIALKKDRDFDLILCDLMMPKMSGMDFYDLVREIDRNLAERMVFITGGTFTTRAMEFRKKVSNPFIEKTVDPSKLAKLVQDLIDSKKSP